MAALRLGILALSTVLAAACAEDTAAEGGEPVAGGITAALRIPSKTEDVAAIKFKVVKKYDECDSKKVLAEALVKLEEEYLPEQLGPKGTGDTHRFSDAFFVLPSGEYRVCAKPVRKDGEPSRKCEKAEAKAKVFEEKTTEIALVLQCEGDPNGALDAIALLNQPPEIEDLDIKESKFITTCEKAYLLVYASDPDHDELKYWWSQVSGPAKGFLKFEGPEAVFATKVPGDYELKVKVFDKLGAETSLTFPIHVSECKKKENNDQPLPAET